MSAANAHYVESTFCLLGSNVLWKSGPGGLLWSCMHPGATLSQIANTCLCPESQLLDAHVYGLTALTWPASGFISKSSGLSSWLIYRNYKFTMNWNALFSWSCYCFCCGSLKYIYYKYWFFLLIPILYFHTLMGKPEFNTCFQLDS